MHGGRAVERAVSDALQAAGLRPAEPGEFTKRAFDVSFGSSRAIYVD